MASTESGRLPARRGVFALVFVDAVAEYSAWIAVLVVAFERGGSSAAGIAVIAQLAPAALFAPVVAAAGDRFPRHRVLATAFSIEAIAAAGIALALTIDAPIWVVFALASVFTVATIATPATVASLLVHHARTPTELVKWNITRSSVRAVGSLAGPLLAALVLAVAGPEAIFVGVFMLCSATAVLATARLPHDDRLPSPLSVGTVLGDSWRGITYVAQHASPRRIVVFIGFSEMFIGALDLVFVAVAFDRLDGDGSAVALIGVAFATGTLVAAALASRRTTWPLSALATLGSLLLTLPLLVIGETTVLVVVLALAVVLGAGNGYIEIGTQTLLQRSCAENMTSRAFGALDSTVMIAASVGAVVAGRLLDERDLTAVVVALALIGAAGLLVGSLRLRAIEGSLRAGDPALVSCLRAVTFLEALPQPTLERLARTSERRSAPAGVAVVTEGQLGDEFFVMMSGTAEVSSESTAVGRLSAPASFGEVALLHDNVRTATVTTTTPCEFAVIRQPDFLDAIRRTATSHRSALDVADKYQRPTNPR